MEKDLDNRPFQLALDFVRYTDKNTFLTGKAGSGKTTFLKTVKQTCNKNMVLLAPTGVAATNAGGTTIHSFFQLPLGAFLPGIRLLSQPTDFYNGDTLVRNLNIPIEKKELLQHIELIIIDEISMVRADLLDAIDILLRHYRQQPQLAFGGIQMVFIGDLYQLPPIVKNEDWDHLKQSYNSLFFFSAHALTNAPLLIIELQKIYRQTDPIFVDLLNNIRGNSCTAADISLLNTKYNPTFSPSGIRPITLTTHNRKADEINEAQLSALEGKTRLFEALITGNFPDKNYPADKSLRLKEGAQIMLIKNDIGRQRKYFNGKLGFVEKIEQDVIHIRFADSTLIAVQRETWGNVRYTYNTTGHTINEEQAGTFQQFPVRLAWAITIHKSQGLTFEKALIDAGESFSPGQVYVALSRLTALDGLTLTSKIHPAAISVDQRIAEYFMSNQATGNLEKELQEGKLSFLFKMLLQGFSFVLPEHMICEHSSWYPETLSNIASLEKVKGLVVISERFRHELIILFNDGLAPDFEKILERTMAASSYFVHLTDELLAGLLSYSSRLQTEKYSKDQVVSIKALTEVFIKHKGKLEDAVSIAEGLAGSINTGHIYEKLWAKKKQDLSTVESHLSKKRDPTGATEKVTLQMFRTGLPVQEIARKRKMATTTVELHLLKAVQTGALSAYEWIPLAKLNMILPLINNDNCNAPAKIKQHAPAECSYLEIRAAASHWKMSYVKND